MSSLFISYHCDVLQKVCLNKTEEIVEPFSNIIEKIKELTECDNDCQLTHSILSLITYLIDDEIFNKIFI